MGCIYIAHFGNLEKIYIGSTDNFPRRKAQHLCKLIKNKHNSKHFQNAFNKYGNENFFIEIFEDDIPNEDLLAWEQAAFEYFAYTGKEIPYYNKREFANTNFGVRFSEETKNKMSISKMGIKTGRTMSDENKLKMSIRQKGKKLNKDIIIKMSENSKKTHCKNGHQFTLENSYYRDLKRTKRDCKACLTIKRELKRKGRNWKYSKILKLQIKYFYSTGLYSYSILGKMFGIQKGSIAFIIKSSL